MPRGQSLARQSKHHGGRQFFPGFFKSHQSMSSSQTPGVDEAVHEAGLHGRKVGHGEDRQGGGTDTQSFGFSQGGDGGQGIRFGEMIERLEREIAFGKHKIADENRNARYELFLNELGRHLEQGGGFLREETDDDGSIQTQASRFRHRSGMV